MISIVFGEYGIDYSIPVDLYPWKWHDGGWMYDTISLLSQCAAVKLDCLNQYFRGVVNQTACLPIGAIYLLWLITFTLNTLLAHDEIMYVNLSIYHIL